MLRLSNKLDGNIGKCQSKVESAVDSQERADEPSIPELSPSKDCPVKAASDWSVSPYLSSDWLRSDLFGLGWIARSSLLFCQQLP